jgi:hypothetical protein
MAPVPYQVYYAAIFSPDCGLIGPHDVVSAHLQNENYDVETPKVIALVERAEFDKAVQHCVEEKAVMRRTEAASQQLIHDLQAQVRDLLGNPAGGTVSYREHMRVMRERDDALNKIARVLQFVNNVSKSWSIPAAWDCFGYCRSESEEDG